MPPLLVTLETLLGVILLLLLVIVGFIVRRRTLQRAGATFDCSLRETLASHGRGWTLGLARYGEDSIEWFRVFSWSPRPRRTYARNELAVRSRRRPTGPEALAVTPGAIVVQCTASGGRVLELAMAEDSLTGFLAWLEAAPPGRGRLAG